MEELADAIEDAQYVNAIASQDEGPRPVIRWDVPESMDVLLEWERTSQQSFDYPHVLAHPIPFYFWSAYVKDKHQEYPRMNFVEDAVRYERTVAADGLSTIALRYLGYQSAPKSVTETTTASSTSDETTTTEKQQQQRKYTWKLPPRTEIEETDLCIAKLVDEEKTGKEEGEATADSKKEGEKNTVAEEVENATSPEEGKPDRCIDAATLEASNDYPVCSESPIGLKGPVRRAILKLLEDMGQATTTAALSRTVLHTARAVVLQSLHDTYWEVFLQSPQWLRCRQLLWYRDARPVVPNDFFVMRVLGRGGFGLVNACKKGTSGKLYAMKVMNKRRIKSKKSEQLALNERQALAAVDSNFVIRLSYSFQSKDDIYLILDLMTGGDLGFHLHMRRSFSKRECIYYTARIMLGLQHLHDQNYVYRDLKPENCLLADDGRVKITDLGLAVQLTPTLHGAAGTRGYWAPEMLRRDARGKRCNYTQMVDWFSLGCCLAEFISGSNPFRSEAALQFGQERGKATKEKCIDCATLEMDPTFPPERGFDADSIDLCQRLLDKNEHTRLGGATDIMAHPYFAGVHWDSILHDRKKPPFIPAKDVNAASQSEIGTFPDATDGGAAATAPVEDACYKDWEWVNDRSFNTEVLEFLMYERQTGEPLVPLNEHGTCCCAIV